MRALHGVGDELHDRLAQAHGVSFQCGELKINFDTLQLSSEVSQQTKASKKKPLKRGFSYLAKTGKPIRHKNK